MRKEYDFSNGRQGRFAGVDFEIVGGNKSVKTNPNFVLAVCLDNHGLALIVGKIYSVTIEDDNFTVTDEMGFEIDCPFNTFLPIEFERKIANQIYALVTV